MPMDNNSNSTSSWPGAEDARRHLSILFRGSGAVVELRALGVRGVYGSGVVAGYFDNPDALIAAAAAVDGNAEGIYVTLNPVRPELLARAANRVVERPKQATTDNSITRRCNLLIDIDSIRASGISATDEEKKCAFEVARNIQEFLTALGFPDPVLSDSGNGAHLNHAIDLPVEDGGLVERCLAALAFRFDTDRARVDTSVGNSSRICKLYGTTVCKGDSTAERPHRRSRILALPLPLITVPQAALEALAALAPKVSEARAVPSSVAGARFDIDAFLSRHGIEVLRSSPWQGGQRWILKVCPFNDEHGRGEAYVLQLQSGALAAGCQHASCVWDWHALRARFEPAHAITRSSTQDAAPPPTPPTGLQFRALRDLPSGLLPVPAFDFSLLPDRLSPWVRDIVERVQCPPDFVAAAVMVGLGAVVGRKIGIRPKQKDDWIEVPNLWGGAVGRSGIMKTPALQEAFRPLLLIEVAARDKYDEQCRAYVNGQIIESQRKKVIEEEIKKAIRSHKGDPQTIVSTLNTSGIVKPIRRRLVINDSTIEKLGEILRDNPNGLLAFRDELTGLLRSLDKEGQETARAFMLECWNGKSRYTFDRIGRGTVDVEAAIVSVFGGIQPGPLGGYLRGAMEQGRFDDGLIQRFQLLVYPDVSSEWHNVDRWADTEARKAAYATYDYLDHLDVVSLCREWADAPTEGIAYLRFAEAAQPRFDAWRTELELRLRSGEESPSLESHFAKYRGLIPKLALLIHLAERGQGNVALSALERAIG